MLCVCTYYIYICTLLLTPLSTRDRPSECTLHNPKTHDPHLTRVPITAVLPNLVSKYILYNKNNPNERSWTENKNRLRVTFN